MITRSKSGIFKPKLNTSCIINDEPETYEREIGNEK